jgi:hypothetical protein
LAGEIPSILNICDIGAVSSSPAVSWTLIPLPARNISAGRPVVLDTVPLPLFFLAPRMVKKLEWIEMAQLATILFSEGPAEMPAGGSMKMQGRQVIESPSAPILRTAWSLP